VTLDMYEPRKLHGMTEEELYRGFYEEMVTLKPSLLSCNGDRVPRLMDVMQHEVERRRRNKEKKRRANPPHVSRFD